MTYTYVLMEVSSEAYKEIKQRLLDAGYSHAIHEDEKGALDMRGIALIETPPPPKATSHASTSPGPVNCSIRKRFQGKSYPRTCERCKLGPCPFFNEDGTSKT